MDVLGIFIMLGFFITVCILLSQLVGTDDCALVNHYQFTSWPDYGVPDSVSPFMTFHKRIMNFWSTDMGPIVIHCSAGVGRTGTFIAMDIALEQVNKEEFVDIAGIVTRLRQQRIKMVQTEVSLRGIAVSAMFEGDFIQMYRISTNLYTMLS